MQQGLGKLGEKFGIHADKKPKGTSDDPFGVDPKAETTS
jgi:hypothetical protein